MATKDEVKTKLLDAIAACADQAGATPQSSMGRTAAETAKFLAEALEVVKGTRDPGTRSGGLLN